MLPSPAPRRPAPRRPAHASRRARVGTAVACAASLVALSTAAAAPAAAAQADCPTGAFAFTTELTEGSFRIGAKASSSGATASACGELTNQDGVLTSVVRKENITFDPTTTKVLFLDLPTTVTATSDLSGPVALTGAGIDVSLRGTVRVTTTILGAKCSFPLDLTLTTGTSGGLTGSPLVNDAAGTSRGRIVSNDFTVPALTPSRACNLLVATTTNALLGLPLAAGSSSATFDLALKLGVQP